MIIPNFPWWVWALIGAASSFIVVPIVMSLFFLIKNTIERRSIKRMIKDGKMLQPIDSRDYETDIWDKHLDVQKNKEIFDNLGKRIFKK